jgi:hypothetical protein
MAGTNVQGIGANAMEVMTYAGTGAAITLTIGFAPSMIQIFDTSTPNLAVWSRSMAAATYLNVGASSTQSVTLVSSNGVTVLDGSAGTGYGVTIGTSASINTTSHTYDCVCYR